MPPPLKQAQLLPVPSVQHRIEAFFERIAPLYPDVIAHGLRRHNALKRLQRLCEREVNILSAYGAICCKRFKPQNMTDDVFLAQILGTNSCRGPRPCQSRRVTRISMSWGSEVSW
jgi:hypothetical protein